MALDAQDKVRSIVPRWRSFASTAQSRELDQSVVTSRKASRTDHSLFEAKIREWRENRTLTFARQLVGSALVLRRTGDARDAAEFILSSSKAASPATHLARAVLGESPQLSPSPDIRQFIRTARTQTRIIPSSPVPWVDLALGYTTLLPRQDSVADPWIWEHFGSLSELECWSVS